MLPDLQLDSASDVPAYRQIIERIAALVRAGVLKPGDRLPAARELSAQLGIARGTIAKAYEELARCGVLEVTPGRGSFVSARQDVLPAGRMEHAVKQIKALVEELKGLRFSSREIKNLLDVVLLELDEQLENLHLAMVDCSPEALSMFSRQLGMLSQIDIKTILLDELASQPEPQRRLSEFDLILTTATHHSELLGLAEGLRDKLVQLVVSPSQETIVRLAAIKPVQSLGALCQSDRFLAIITHMLDALGITNRIASLTYPVDAEALRAFIADKEVLIVPPDFSALMNRPLAPVLAEFTERGGQLIQFDYQIQRGSLIYLEERIKGLKEP